MQRLIDCTDSVVTTLFSGCKKQYCQLKKKVTKSIALPVYSFPS